jgi:hypothetical protein
MTRLMIIDSLIERHGLLGRKCEMGRQRSGRCQCGHHDGAHLLLNPDAHWRNRIRGGCLGHLTKGGGRRPCPCVAFSPYTYRKEEQAKLKKLRMFALDLLDAIEDQATKGPTP